MGMPDIQEARARLARTVFDPTLRQLLAELFAKEQAELLADRALAAAAERIAELERDLAAARARVDQLGCRLDDLEGRRPQDDVSFAAPPRVVDLAAVP